MKRSVISLLLVLVLVVAMFAGCGEKAPATETPSASTEATTEGATETGGEAKTLEAAFAEKPVILTSLGQSQELQMLKTVLDKEDSFEYSIDNLLTAEGLGDNKTLVVVVGGSSKGLGAAGIDAEGEIARGDALLKAAKDNGMSIIVLHLGKDARRGDLSDKFIHPALEVADYIIVAEGGNDDGIFTDAAIKSDAPIEVIPSIGKAGEAFVKAFK